jgi:hypothetical protein
MTRRRTIRISIAVISLCALSTAARAQSAEAQARFDDGVRLMKANKLDEACAAFETSNRLEPRAGTLVRLGECREANHQLAAAWSAYQDALTKATDPKKKAFAAGRIKVLEPKLSKLTLNVPPKARVKGLEIQRDGNGVDAGLWNVAVPVDGGEYAITASAPGHVAWSARIAVPVAGGQVAVDVPALADAPAPTTPNITTTKPEQHDGEPLPPEPPPEGTFTSRRKLALGVLGGGVVVTAVGLVLGSSGKSKRDDAYALCPDPMVACARASDANTLIADAHTRGIEADVAFGVAGAAAVVAAVLWFTGAPHAESAHVEASASSHGGGLAIVGRF